MPREQTKRFFIFVIPSVLSFALAGVYSIVDGFFVGNSIGDIGLSAINVAYPLVALMQALGTGIGMGGSVLYAIADASGKQDAAKQYARGIFTLLLLFSVVITGLCLLLLSPILTLLGAEGRIFDLGYLYLQVIVLGGVFQIFATGVVPLVRNLGGAVFAMVSMVSGFLTNILLDYVMIWLWEMGMVGAALATVIGQVLTMVLGLGYILVKRRSLFGFTFRGLGLLIRKIIKIGGAPFGLTMSPMISLILMNRFSLAWGGEPGITCYACIAYVVYIVVTFLQGVGDGCQPLVSKHYGQKDTASWHFIRRLAYCTALVLALFGAALLYVTRGLIGPLFGASEVVSEMIVGCMWIFLLAYIFPFFTRVTTSCFYATEQTVFSYILVYVEPLLLWLSLLIVPRFLGLDGVWWSVLLAQAICFVIAVVLKVISDRKERLPAASVTKER